MLNRHLSADLTDYALRSFAFVEYARPEDAEKAFERLNGYKLDNAHIFKVPSIKRSRY